MKSLYIGAKRALVFPALCEGYLRIDYSNQVAGQPIGIFGHSDSFTIEAIITPYDINGNGWKLEGSTTGDNPAGESGVITSVKTFPNVQSYNTTETQFQDFNYDSDRTNNTMTIFSNGDVDLSLINSTSTSHNQPAEYTISFGVNANGFDTLTSDTIFTSRTESTGTLDYTKPGAGGATDNVYHTGNNSNKYQEALTTVLAHTDGLSDFTITGTGNENFWVGQDLYTRSGQTFTSIGTIQTIVSSTITMSQAITPSITGATLYTSAYREAPYLLTSHHIAAAFNPDSGAMHIYYNGQLISSKTHTSAASLPFNFQMPEEDMYIGQNVSGGHTTQFFGEIHEFAVIDGFKTQYDSIFTLAPKFDRTLLYYRFEEVDI